MGIGIDIGGRPARDVRTAREKLEAAWREAGATDPARVDEPASIVL